MEEDLDNRAVNGFEKWKDHREKMLMKGYVQKPNKKQRE